MLERSALGLDLRKNRKSLAGHSRPCDQQFAGVFGRHGPPPLADVETNFQLRSRFANVLNVPQRVRLRFLLASGLAGSHFDHPAFIPRLLIRSTPELRISLVSQSIASILIVRPETDTPLEQ